MLDLREIDILEVPNNGIESSFRQFLFFSDIEHCEFRVVCGGLGGNLEDAAEPRVS